MVTPGLIQGGRGNLPNTHFQCFLKKDTKKPPTNSKWLNVLRNGNTWLDSGREGKSTKYSLLSYFEKKHPKAQCFFKWLRYSILATSGLNLQGTGGNLPNTHLWRILKKSHPKMAPKWQRRIGNSKMNSFTAHRICWSYYQKFVEVVVHNHLCFAS